MYYVPTPNPDPYLPNITNRLNSIASQISAEGAWRMSNVEVFDNFAATGASQRFKPFSITDIG
jgi:hypothetical protein